ncbi:MAG: amino acid dehydrogenase [Bacteroidia bacterium]|nr:amino acid dehydrogenase [Bacteroidia bacterium]
MLTILEKFENKSPEIVFHWKDQETEAEGWVVINSLRNGAAGGGTRMRKGLEMNEVLSLAKTMEVKFNVCGPYIGGAKSGINFDPEDPRKGGVLKRWYTAILPLLKAYYGTGGDLNVDELHEVMPITYDLGLLHPQEGVVNGHLRLEENEKAVLIEQLRIGVAKPVTNWEYAPTTTEKVITVSDMITGYGVGMAVVHACNLWDIPENKKRVIVQGFGNVGGAAALTLAKEGFTIVGIIDRSGGLLDKEGLGLDEIKDLYFSREGTKLISPNLLPFEAINREVWSVGADIFIPAAGSRLVTRSQSEELVKKGLKIVSCGANVPFADPDIFLGETGIWLDERVGVIPDFIANCGMARTFAYLMQPEISLEDDAIFQDVSQTILNALRRTREATQATNRWWQTSLDWVLQDIM